jgi:hypothetical protein
VKIPKTVKFKTYIATVAIIVTLFATAISVIGQTTGTFTISQGIYPGAPAYTIDRSIDKLPNEISGLCATPQALRTPHVIS